MKYFTVLLLVTCTVALPLAQRGVRRKLKLEEDKLDALDSAVENGELAFEILDKGIELVQALGGAEQLKNRHRSLELVIANDLPNTKLRFAEEYFSSGTWFSQPEAGVAAMGATIATVANRQGSILTGVTGGMSWEIVGTGKYLVIGFTNPQAGSYKTWIGVRNQRSAEYGYNQSNDVVPKRYCQDGFSLIARMEQSDIANRKFIFGIGDCTE